MKAVSETGKLCNWLLLFVLLCLWLPGPVLAENRQTYSIGELVVSGKHADDAIKQTPEKTAIELNSYDAPGLVQNVGEIIQDQVIIDSRGASDLVPGDVVDGDDTHWMRGFRSNRFVTAIDGSNIHKPGGRQTFHVVDYSLLPAFLIDRVEILPGPHSALYPAQSIGGVVNLITRTPRPYATIRPEASVVTSYKSYDTQNHSAYLRGGAGDVVYDLGYQRYSTDGYLRHSKAEIDTLFGRLSYVLPADGYISFTCSHTDANREVPTKNDPSLADFRGSYPEVTTSAYLDWQQPEWDESAISYRVNYNQPTRLGTWDLNTYYSLEEWTRTTLRNGAAGIYDAGWKATWRQQGGKLQDTIELSDRHQLIVGTELQQFFDSNDTKQGSLTAFNDKKRVETRAGFAQLRWQAMPRLTLTGGLRYEQADVCTDNRSSSGGVLITGKPDWIERDFDSWLPKAFVTYELDDVWSGLRDTSVSVGASKIWRAPINFGDFNPRGMPAGAWVEPEHGMGYDLVLARRLLKDIQLKLNYSYYEIEDYLTWNWDYARYTPSKTNPVAPGMEYLDYIINLDKVVRHGLEVQLNGHLLDNLAFYLGYAYQRFDYRGLEPAGETELDDIARNRVNAGLKYNLSDDTSVLVDYRYQDDQIAKQSEEIAPDVWVYTKIPMSEYHVFDLAVQQVLFRDKAALKCASMKIFVNNLLDRDYQELSGYPATDRTYGVALNLEF